MIYKTKARAGFAASARGWRPWSIVLAGLLACVVNAQEAPEPAAPKKPQVLSVTVRILGGQDKTPIQGARIYIRGEKDDTELGDAKTNSKGVAVLDEIPRGRIRIQVTATNWDTHAGVVDLAHPKLALPIEIVLSAREAKTK